MGGCPVYSVGDKVSAFIKDRVVSGELTAVYANYMVLQCPGKWFVIYPADKITRHSSLITHHLSL
jgi:hypothetical protein